MNLSRSIKKVLLSSIVILQASTVTAQRVDRLSDETLQSIYRWSGLFQVDPQLVIAIVLVESGGNPMARGSVGEIGLMQLRPEYHPEASFNVDDNIRIGVGYLVEVRKICQPVYGRYWFVCYNRGPYASRLKWPEKFPYVREVTNAVR